MKARAIEYLSLNNVYLKMGFYSFSDKYINFLYYVWLNENLNQEFVELFLE